jgi:hypothetical protein
MGNIQAPLDSAIAEGLQWIHKTAVSLKVN